MKIVIKLQSMFDNTLIQINDEKQIFKVNGKTVKTNIDEFVSKLITIVSTWPVILVDDSVVDGSSYSVEIVKNDIKYSFVGKNKFPFNYNDFIKLIKGVVNV